MEVTGEGEHQRTRFTVADVHWFLDLANSADIKVWLVGGWGVDALLGGETRPHTDLDIVVQQAQHEALRNMLEAHGFSVLLDADHRPWNYVLVDAAGRRIDFHVVRFDQDGCGLYEPGFSYPPGSLVGDGVISGVPVRCATPSFQVEDHLGYEPQLAVVVAARDIVALDSIDSITGWRLHVRRVAASAPTAGTDRRRAVRITHPLRATSTPWLPRHDAR